ncbi:MULTISPECIES: hypothetical protein [unclassified Mesorhizobium]|uniref:hypothetical protein n=1 Tax=unclassified Mesorhizobium TaxID=325217 RepID=UPI001CCE4539|nr:MULTISPECIES: hypothetical protein [unclassified Mesorhizobium]MBZ9737790.1 hypothetical protein [Mesorhizobium sp. CO1-1-4]MBZ9802022.1 hypothetical protein [Mesorhizobium sp. ES1-6]
MTVEIRRLYPGDDALVMRVADDVFDEPVRADHLASYLAQSGHFMIMALAGALSSANARRSSTAIRTSRPNFISTR